MKKVLLSALIALPLLSGCVVAVSDGEVEHSWGNQKSDWQDTQRSNRDKIAKLALGTEYNSVISQFSTPDFTESLEKNEVVYQILYFATQSKHSDGKVTKDECTPLLFKNGKLAGFGETALKQLL
ncbi:DUF3192 domain-containing protein [Pseudoalteromonas xiamenensis]|uniref:DUF3192 domain-containing protein n=1 Tax=Pseudoalteromonas xiamenensis TaxID=882626 RepID=UPI0027E54704|nr:DUF3192 domain-containing protein [Pseudoalteromonas xiamenensis]WMN59163.1 DUF3192 domain-containing protein [Pseudoalteromonas xiamenensis]